MAKKEVVAKLEIPYQETLRTVQGTFDAIIEILVEDDRIEIRSLGGPYGNVTTENFGKPGIADYRNPNIGDVLKTFGYIQAFGRGIVTALFGHLERSNGITTNVRDFIPFRL